MELNIDRNIIIKNPATKDFLADVYYPKHQEKLPLVIFAHGYKGYKDWGAWDLMAKEFAQAGFFFVKFNFSHNGTTVDQPSDFADLEAFGNNNFSIEMSDYDEVLNYFYNHPKIDQEKITIIGHSRGGGITVIKAAEDERVKAVVILAGVSHFGYRFPSDERLVEWEKEGVMYSENGRTHQQMPHYFQFFQDYKANEQRFNIQHAAHHLEKPTLILQGTADEAVKEKEANLLNDWIKDSELFLIQEANHTFGSKEPWRESKLPNDLGIATAKMISFLKTYF
ncbi:alpha/beta fold hydrolase [Chryseobacterium sp. SNU WT5]|uniref:alpha/beta hydrolase family protein n=1 Tax=Chryseobacterium sp. SNU WT5 TaxID=2594269 RepID=UPI00117C0A6F|nr:alpha/beta fold hydrolase [Chryseobacterium sp. SNU WT5]QDP85999.1 alpha/beta fold hydrolase [Chryseobacterium sp. SNU WT5]